MNITKWKPDTCDCTLFYSVEGDVVTPIDECTNNLGEVQKTEYCEAHQGSTLEDLHNAVRGENTLKNKLFGKLQESNPDLPYEDYKWSFDKDRKLVVEVKGLEKEAVSAVIDEHLVEAKESITIA